MGSILRFLVWNLCKIYFPNFPIGTLLVNILGSFFIGLFIGYLNSKSVPEIVIRYFLIIGILGSFTTFSTFAIEVLELFKQDSLSLSLVYIMLSIVLSISAAYLGLILLKY